MLLKTATCAVALAGLITSSTAAFARGIGCPDLPAYARAQGTLQMGEGACNMTKEEAWRILRQERPDLYGAAAAPPPVHRKRHRHRPRD